MTRPGTEQEPANALVSTNAVEEWLKAEPALTADFAADRNAFSAYWRKAAELLARLPASSLRSEAEQAAAAAIRDRASAARNRFLRIHVNAIYDALTVRRSLFVRI
jgi:thioesterase DpgC